MITKLQKNPASIRFWNKIQFFNSTIFILLYMEKPRLKSKHILKDLKN